jgi:hypothetical protein
MLVPEFMPHVLPGRVELMHTPGAAIVCARPSAVEAKFVNESGVSSAWLEPHDVFAPAPPPAPLLSVTEVTVRTSG